MHPKCPRLAKPANLMDQKRNFSSRRAVQNTLFKPIYAIEMSYPDDRLRLDMNIPFRPRWTPHTCTRPHPPGTPQRYAACKHLPPSTSGSTSTA